MASTGLIYGCNEPKIKSKWSSRDITVDGIDSEWEDCRLYYDKDIRTTLGFFNDDDYLYVNFITSDPSIQRQIVTQGFTLWFDPKGGKEKHMGIFYPTGMLAWQSFGNRSITRHRQPDEGDEVGEPMEDNRGHGPRGNRAPGDENFDGPSQMLSKMMEQMPQVIDIKVPDGVGGWDRVFLDENNASGIQAKVSLVERRLVYELKIPMVQNERVPYGIAVSKKRIIGVGFETEKIEARFGNRNGPMDGGMGRPGGRGRPHLNPGDDMGPPENGMGGSDRRGERGGHFKRPELKPVEFWIQVKLANKP